MTAQIISLRTRQPEPVALVRAWVPKINERVLVTLAGWEGEPPVEFSGVVKGGDGKRWMVQLEGGYQGCPIPVGLHEMRPEPKGAA